MILEGFAQISAGTADVVTTAMWFLFALIVLVVFRRPVARLIGGIEEIRYRDLTIDTDAADQVAEANQIDPEERRDYQTLAQETPRYAVREGWAVLEGALAEVPAPPDKRTFRSRLRALRDAGVLDDRELEAFDALRFAVARIKDDTGARVSPEDATTLARCGVGLAQRLSHLDADKVRDALGV